MAHQDVVPAEGEWKYPAFSGTVADGKVWGRGAMDCKCTLFCTLKSVDELIADGFVPEQDIYLSYSDNEETSGHGATYCRDWLTAHGVKPAVAIDEGGAIIERAFPGMTKPFAMIGILEKGYCDVKFVARSKGEYAVRKARRLCELLRDSHHLQAAYDPRGARDAERAVLGAHGRARVRHQTRRALQARHRESPAQAHALRRGAARHDDDLHHGGGPAPNVIPQAASMTANLRFAPGDNSKECIEKLRRIAAKFDIETHPMECRDATPMIDMESAGYKLFVDTVAKVFPDCGAAPYLIFGGTDCRTMQTITPCAIRCTPCKMSSEQLAAMHAANENIDISSLIGGVNFFKAYIKGYK